MQNVPNEPKLDSENIKAEHRFSFDGQAMDLLMIYFENMLFNILTLGIYYPWARTKMRAYLWANTKLDGIPFHYTGTGKELFLGYLRLLSFYVGVSGIIFALDWLQESEHGTAIVVPLLWILKGAVMVFFMFVLIPLAMWGKHSYRSRRTYFRGLGFHMNATKRKPFYKQTALGLLVTYLSLGIYGPFFMNKMVKSLVESSHFGDQSFKYSGKGWDYFWISVTNLIFILLTLGLFIPWAILRGIKYRVNHLSYAGASCRTTLTGGQILGLWLLQVFLVPISGGLAFPYVKVLTMRRFAESMVIEGAINFEQIIATASQAEPSTIGETAADYFDVDMI